jgi:hypothetical protein
VTGLTTITVELGFGSGGAFGFSIFICPVE